VKIGHLATAEVSALGDCSMGDSLHSLTSEQKSLFPVGKISKLRLQIHLEIACLKDQPLPCIIFQLC